MRISFARTVLIFLAFACLAGAVAGQETEPGLIPNPVLAFVGQEFYEAGGKQFTRYRYTVDNLAEYPNELFAPSPALPACGRNTNASRTWVDVFDQTGRRLNGFCALANHDGLNGIWFAMVRDEIPPSWVYIELTDRQTSTKYKSSLAETTL